MGTWTNSDGLFIKFNADEAKEPLGGQVVTAGSRQTLEFVVNASDFNAFANTIVADNVFIPSNAYIEAAEIYVETAFAGATGTLDVGFIRKDRTTEIDYDGIDAAVAVAALAAKALITCDGALIRSRLSNAGLVTVRNNTADFTVGKATIKIHYSI